MEVNNRGLNNPAELTECFFGGEKGKHLCDKA